jgi:subtilisin family serine protease
MMAFLLLVPLFAAAPLLDDAALKPSGVLSESGASPGIAFDSLGGNTWWLQARATGSWATQVRSVQAMDTNGPWVQLARQPWSDCACWWAGSLAIEPGHEVRLRATLQTGLVIDSCWASHPAGLATCEASAAETGALGPSGLGDPAPGTGQILAGFVPGNLPGLTPGQAIMGLPVLARIPQVSVLVLQASDLARASTLLGVVPGLAYVESDGAVQSSGLPNDPRLGGQYAPAMLGLPAVWSANGYGSSSVVVAVIDSGIAAGHPDLRGTRLLAGYDYVNGDGVPNDECGHGTHVAGIVGATTDNGVGIAGVSQASLLPLKVLGRTCSGTLSNVARAIVDATDQHAAILTMSLGSSSDSRTLGAAVAYAWDHGVILVAAAGNGGSDGAVHYPAAYSQVIAVSALDASKSLAGYSSRGAKVEVAAPGSQIDSTAANGGYTVMSGTSMATPQVAGVLALALSCHPGMANQPLRSALAASAEDLGEPGRDVKFGHGLARADKLVGLVCGSPLPSTGPTPPASSSSSTSSTGSPSLSTTSSQSPSPSPSPAPPPSFSALFAPANGCNEWWVEVSVTANEPVVAVMVRVDGGAPHALPRTSWGAWAASFNVPRGSSVIFFADNAAGDRATSATYAWLGAPPPAAAFSAYFTPKSVGNEWWVESAVQGSQPIGAVEVRLGGGAWTALPKTDWGSWAKSLHVVPGTTVVFRATSTTGATQTSPSYAWT